MKILQINKYYPPWIGGIERVVQDVAEGLADAAQSTVLCINPEGTRHVTTHGAVTVYRAARGISLFGMPISLDFFRLGIPLLREADLVIVHHPFPLSFILYWLFGRRKRVWVWYHSDIIRQKITGYCVRPLLHAVLRRAEKIIVAHHSLVAASTLLTQYASKVDVVPFYVNVEQFELKDIELVRHLKARYGTPLVLAVGRLVYYKGYEYLIKAWQGIDAQLLIIGTGPLRQHLQQVIEDHELEQRVIIIEPVADLVPYYQAADLLVLSSVACSETFGIVQLEAMACGKPVINTSLPTAVPEVSLHEQTGLTVPPRDAAALHTAIQTLLADSKLRAQYGTAARQRVEHYFSKQNFLSTLRTYLSSLV